MVMNEVKNCEGYHCVSDVDFTVLFPLLEVEGRRVENCHLQFGRPPLYFLELLPVLPLLLLQFLQFPPALHLLLLLLHFVLPQQAPHPRQSFHALRRDLVQPQHIFLLYLPQSRPNVVAGVLLTFELFLGIGQHDADMGEGLVEGSQQGVLRFLDLLLVSCEVGEQHSGIFKKTNLLVGLQPSVAGRSLCALHHGVERA